MLRSSSPWFGVALGLFLGASAAASAQPGTDPRLARLETLKREQGWTFGLRYTEVLERPLPPRISLRVGSAQPSGEQEGDSRDALDTSHKASGEPSVAQCHSEAGQWDWRTGGAVGEVRDQKGCLACWAFAAATAFEGNYYLRHGLHISVSEQNVLDCAPAASDCGGGGHVTDAYSVFKTKGAVEATVGPSSEIRPGSLEKSSDNCQTSSRRMLARKWGYVDANKVIARTPDIKRALCAYGPVVALVRATKAMQAYKDGVFNEDDGPVSLTVQTPYGSKTAASIAAGGSVAYSFTTRVTNVEPGTVTVSATDDAGTTAVTATPYSAAACG